MSEPAPPGQVVAHSAARSRAYIGSPSLARLPNRDLIASHDLFGPGSSRDTTVLYRSTDDGATWSKLTELTGQWWSNLFWHDDALYLMGTTTEYGDVVIRRSDDGGVSWTTPDSPTNGLLLQGEYHTAPVPVVTANGRLWRAMEDASGGDGWGERFKAFVMSAPLGADLLDATSWTSTTPLERQSDWLPAGCRAWLEGNVVVAPDGHLVDVLRVDSDDNHRMRAAIVRISPDGTSATFDPAADFVTMPGGLTKFTIRHDEATGDYIALVNHVADPARWQRGLRARNTLLLARSADLRTWAVSEPLLQHPDDQHHAFQYVDWLFDGRDLIYLSRTAWDEPDGTPARNFHDANYLTFHRLAGFRALATRPA